MPASPTAACSSVCISKAPEPCFLAFPEAQESGSLCSTGQGQIYSMWIESLYFICMLTVYCDSYVI